MLLTQFQESMLFESLLIMTVYIQTELLIFQSTFISTLYYGYFQTYGKEKEL